MTRLFSTPENFHSRFTRNEKPAPKNGARKMEWIYGTGFWSVCHGPYDTRPENEMGLLYNASQVPHGVKHTIQEQSELNCCELRHQRHMRLRDSDLPGLRLADNRWPDCNQHATTSHVKYNPCDLLSTSASNILIFITQHFHSTDINLRGNGGRSDQCSVKACLSKQKRFKSRRYENRQRDADENWCDSEFQTDGVENRKAHLLKSVSRWIISKQQWRSTRVWQCTRVVILRTRTCIMWTRTWTWTRIHWTRT